MSSDSHNTSRIPDPPTRSSLHDNSLEARIQDLLDELNVGKGAWIEGRLAFWRVLACGGLFDEGVRAALEATGKAVDDRRVARLYAAHFSPHEGSQGRNWLSSTIHDIRGTLGSRRTHS